jgi:L,D-peptidoglycan transpeptidase YkuD (ErfK/YbiS/YcfS/YnhG family)
MRLVVLGLAMMLAVTARGAGVPADCRQLLVAIAPDWNSQTGNLQRYERDSAGAAWRAVGTPVPVLFGREGLAWGSGVEGQNEPGRKKAERDRRVPAGIFAIGKIYTSDASLPAGADYPFHRVTDADVWSDDPTNPAYNRHAVYAEPASRPAWFQKQKMKPHDPVYRWLIEIRHNSDPIVAGAGSAIFFHIRRGETKPSSGCTTMREADIVEIVRWLRAAAKPHYAVMPAAEYAARQRTWNLPTR